MEIKLPWISGGTRAGPNPSQSAEFAAGSACSAPVPLAGQEELPACPCQIIPADHGIMEHPQGWELSRHSEIPWEELVAR